MIEVLNKYKEASKAIINKKMKDKLNLLFNQILYINGPIVVDAIKKSNSKTINITIEEIITNEDPANVL